jgi:phosphatidate phosphatase APP1
VTSLVLLTAILVSTTMVVFVLFPDLLSSNISGLIVPPALGRPGTVWISGRVVHESPDRGHRALRALRSLAAPNWTGAPVEVRFLGRLARTVSGHDGEFEIEISAGPGEPFPVGVQTVEVEAPGARAAAVIHVIADDAPFLVLSDFDDTLAVSHVTSKARLFATTFFEDSDSHPPVDGMPALYRCLASGKRSAPGFAVVSGWPFQFAPRLVRFLEVNGFPAMALFLRNLGPSTLHGYKEPFLNKLASRFPHPLVLVGDSGEQDPEIYGALARSLPGRVLRIYIREADVVGPHSRFEGMCLFADPAEAVRDAVGRGLGTDGAGPP